jgi:hypothetical protein
VEPSSVTGIIGAVTGTLALIVSIKSYIRVSAMKALDLRLEIGRAFNNLDVLLSGVEDRLDYVRKSHFAVLAAIGMYQSGQKQKFDADFEADKMRLRSLLGTQPKREVDYRGRDPAYLESLLTDIHALQVQVADLRAKYDRIYAGDEERRTEIRASHQ